MKRIFMITLFVLGISVVGVVNNYADDLTSQVKTPVITTSSASDPGTVGS